MDVKVPDLGVDSAEVAEILIAVGDSIRKDDNIVLLESDKASVEVPSSAGGKVTAINVSVGDQVSEGDSLISIEASEADTNLKSESESESGSNASANSNLNASANANDEQDEQDDQDKQTQTAEAVQKTYALPDLGVEQAEVADVMVSSGDKVKAEQSLILVESDKASVEVPAPVAGEVIEILVSSGDTVTNGQDYIIIASEAGSSNARLDKNQPEEDKKDNKKDAKQDNAHSSEPSTSASSTSAHNTTSTQHTTSHPNAKLTETEVNKKLTQVYAGPAVRKLARQLGVDITQVKGSAINRRIVKEDVFGYVKTQLSQNTSSRHPNNAQGSQGATLPNLPDMSKTEIWGEIDTQDLSRLQKVSIPQLNYNTLLPQVTQFDLADITDTERLRGELKADFKQQGIGLTILAFIVKATAYALTQYPRFNSHLSDDNTQIIIRKTVNMGIAVATEDGLIVPVIKHAQDKGIKQLAREIGELATKARDKKLTTTDLQGASFTISSQGNLGGTYFTPLVNWPQVAILGVSEASMHPRWNDKKSSFEPRLMLPLSLSYDHRVINGADAAVFTRYVATLLADPRRILL